MKKLLIIAIAIIGIVFANSSNAMAELAAGAKTKTVTAYYCDNGPGYCLTFYGQGDISISIPGILKTISIKVPVGNIVPNPELGYEEFTKFFLFTNSTDQTTGTGLTDGVLHYSDQNPEFYYYELEEQTVITNLSEWESQTP